MNNLIKIEQTQQGTLAVDSRLIADELGIKHKNLIATIKKYFDKINQFGTLTFETDTFLNSNGARVYIQFCYLNEPQANFVMSLSRNTEIVVEFKFKLVQSFEKAKQVIKEVIPAQNNRIEQLKLELEIAKQNAIAAVASKESRELDHLMFTVHGKEAVLALRGKEDQIVETEKPTIEVIDERHNLKYAGQTLKQLADYLNKVYGFKIKSGAALEKLLEEVGEQGLIGTIPRTVPAKYIPEENLKEAERIIIAKLQHNRQLLLGE